MSRKNRGLGRGIDAIYLENALDTTNESGENTIVILNLGLIDPKSDQPRKFFDKDSLEALANSIKKNGLLQPIIVREYNDGRYQIIAGERRFRASKLAGLEEIPAIILDKDDMSAAEISLIENIQRENLNPTEEAMAFRSLIENYGLTQEELAERIGRSRSAIANTMRLLELPRDILEMLANGDITAGHGRALLGLTEIKNMLPLANKIVEYDMSVRQTEEEVKRLNKQKSDTDLDVIFVDPPVVDYYREMEVRIENILGRIVKIKGTGRKRSLTLFYEDNEDLDNLLKSILGDKYKTEDED